MIAESKPLKHFNMIHLASSLVYPSDFVLFFYLISYYKVKGQFFEIKPWRRFWQVKQVKPTTHARNEGPVGPGISSETYNIKKSKFSTKKFFIVLGLRPQGP